MASYHTRKSDKETYDKAMANNGHLDRQDECKFFGDDVVYGYGLYGYKFYEKDGEYLCDFSMGESCE